MDIKLFDTEKVQDFLRLVAGLDYEGGNPRVKQIVHRIVSDLYKTIEDLNVTPDEFWAGIAYLNRLGTAHEAGLLSPGLGFDAYLDMRMDAEDEALGVKSGTPRTIEGPLYVVGAPDRKSTRLNSSHVAISYAVFCVKQNTSNMPGNARRNHSAS